MHHGIALDAATAAEKAFNAGVDVDMMSHLYDAELPALIRSGKVSMAAVDESVRRVLRVKFALGLFDKPYPTVPEVTAAVAAHRPLVRQAAEESFVLLQNNAGTPGPVLPLPAGARIALIGPLADNANEMRGPDGGAYKAADTITLKDAMESRAAAQGGFLTYAQGTEILSSSEEGFGAAEQAARQADVVVMALGESSAMSGEAGSRAHLDLPGNQQALLRANRRRRKAGGTADLLRTAARAYLGGPTCAIHP